MKIFTWKQRLLVITVTLLLVALFGVLGYLVGTLMNNWKLGIALGVLVSYPFTQWALIRSMKRVHKMENAPKTDA